MTRSTQTSTGEQLAIEGMERAATAAGKEFTNAAIIAIWNYAVAHAEPFTSDVLWDLLPVVRERRALGTIIRRAIDKKVIKATGRYVKSSRPEAHKNPKAEYRSLVFGESPWPRTEKSDEYK